MLAHAVIQEQANTKMQLEKLRAQINPHFLMNTLNTVHWLALMNGQTEIGERVLRSFPKQENFKLLNDHNNNENKIPLTEREYEVLKHLVSGKSNTEIAKELIVSVHTAKAHVCSILQKMCVNDRVQAAVKAVKEGLV